MSGIMNRSQIEATLSGVFATEQVDALAQVFDRIVGDDGEPGTMGSDLRSLTRSTNRIADLQGRTELRMEELATAQGRTELRMEELATAQGRTELRMEELATAQGRTELRMEELATAQGRTELRMERLADALDRTDMHVEQLAAAQGRTDMHVEQLAAAQGRTEVAVKDLAVLTGELQVAQRNTDISLGRLSQQVGSLSNDFGLNLEDFSGALLPSWLDRHHGLTGLVFERCYTVLLDGAVEEIDLMATGELAGLPVTVLAEVKARLGGSEARRMADKLDRVADALQESAVVKVIVGMAIHPSAQEALRERDILLIPYTWINRDRG